MPYQDGSYVTNNIFVGGMVMVDSQEQICS
jgi:hypothetical protein